MASRDERPLTWEDLKSDELRAIARGWVRSTMRTCIAYLAPVIAIVLGILGWWADRAFDKADRVIDSLQIVSEQQAGMREQISANKDGIHWLMERWEK